MAFLAYDNDDASLVKDGTTNTVVMANGSNAVLKSADQDKAGILTASDWLKFQDLLSVEWGQNLSLSQRISSSTYSNKLTITPIKPLLSGSYRVNAGVMVNMNNLRRNQFIRLRYNNSEIGNEFSLESKDEAGSKVIYGTNVGSNSIQNVLFTANINHLTGVMKPFTLQAKLEGRGNAFYIWDFYLKIEKMF